MEQRGEAIGNRLSVFTWIVRVFVHTQIVRVSVVCTWLVRVFVCLVRVFVCIGLVRVFVCIGLVRVSVVCTWLVRVFVCIGLVRVLVCIELVRVFVVDFVLVFAHTPTPSLTFQHLFLMLCHNSAHFWRGAAYLCTSVYQNHPQVSFCQHLP